MVKETFTNKESTDRSTVEAVNTTLDAEIETSISTIADIEAKQRDSRSIGERISDAIAAFCGSMVFVYIHLLWFGAWISVNLVKSLQFDPFPFTFLTLVVSLEAIFLSTFILISQNHETQVAERRNHLDLQINMLAERENTKMIELLQLIAEKIGVEGDDPEARSLLEPMKADRIVEHIKNQIEK